MDVLRQPTPRQTNQQQPPQQQQQQPQAQQPGTNVNNVAMAHHCTVRKVGNIEVFMSTIPQNISPSLKSHVRRKTSFE